MLQKYTTCSLFLPSTQFLYHITLCGLSFTPWKRMKFHANLFHKFNLRSIHSQLPTHCFSLTPKPYRVIYCSCKPLIFQGLSFIITGINLVQSSSKRSNCSGFSRDLRRLLFSMMMILPNCLSVKGRIFTLPFSGI